MQEWKQEKLMSLWQIDKAIKASQDTKKEVMREFKEEIDGLEATRDKILEELERNQPTLFDTKEETVSYDGEVIEGASNYEPPAEDDNQAPEPGTYLGDEDEEPEPPDDVEPGDYFE